MKITTSAPCLAAAAVCSLAAAQTNLYSNAGVTPGDPGLATGAVTAGGAAAPTGKVWSEVQAISATEANAVLGFACHATGNGGTYRFADDFVVPAGVGVVWSLSEVVVYAYSNDGGSAPFAGASLRIWSGAPNSPGAAVIFGDTTTNRLASATLTPILRTASTTPLANAPSPSAPDQSRPVWALTLHLSPPLGLTSGTYWLDWQLDVEPLASAFSPPVTLTGQRAKAGAASNALQFRTAPPPLLDGDWLPVVDTGKPAPAPDVPQDLPFILRGTALAPACGPADVGGTGGVPGRDGVLDNNDFVVFIDWFFAQLPAADRGVTGGIPGSDGAWDNNDFVVFIDQFFAGC